MVAELRMDAVYACFRRASTTIFEALPLSSPPDRTEADDAGYGNVYNPWRSEGHSNRATLLPPQHRHPAPMFCKTSFLALALALLASATPVVHEAGIRIPIKKRSSLTKADGTVDQDAVLRETVRTQKFAPPLPGLGMY